MMKKAFYLTCIIVLCGVISITTSLVRAQVPVNVWGYVYMPDGTLAVGASVSISGGGDSKSTITGSDGKYGPVTLTVSSVPVNIVVSASKDSYSGSASATGEGTVQIDIHLSAAPPPPPPPPSPPPSRKLVSIQLSVPSEAAVNASVRIIGKVNPSVSQVYLKARDPKNILNEYRLSVALNGSFSFDLTPTLLGVYKISAYFPGDSEYEPASTPEYPLQVKARSILNLTLSPTVVVAGAENISISGRLYPPSVQNVLLYYSLDNASWILFAELNATIGVFSMVWKPRFFGDVFIKAEWAGNDTYTGSVAYGRFQTVLPSVCMLRAWVENSPIRIGEEIRVNGILIGVTHPETAELTMRVYNDGKEVETFRLNPSPDGVFTVSYKPGSPGVYVLILEASGVRLLRASNVTKVIVLGEMKLRAVNSTGGLLGEAVVELKHNSEITSSGSGELKIIPNLGDYEVIVKSDGAEVFKGYLGLTSKGISLISIKQSAEFPLPITSRPLIIELRTETYSISVHVVNEFGEPMGNVEVKIAPSPHPVTSRPLNESSVFQTTGRTDAEGRIVFSNIPAGNYTVSTSAESKNVNLIRNESLTLKGSGFNLRIVLILVAVALIVSCFTTFYLARKKPVVEK
ncbi:MAG: carboxypeptidase regulatory-like domain-containing protein [Candidatus Brockarchaeota archaeon]|nr:carboxypeptidase regulatory-like domain-containing protein [Candidatus Brockarchaeota archaeon]